MKKLVKIVNLIAMGSCTLFIVLALFLVNVYNESLREEVRKEKVMVESITEIVKVRVEEKRKLEYKILQLELANLCYKQQIEENKKTLKNYRKYIVDNLTQKDAYYGVK